MRFVFEWLKSLLLSIGLFLVLRTFVVEAFKIPSGSMEHTLLVGDFLLVNKVAYGAEVPGIHSRVPSLRHPKRGDVVVFKSPIDTSKYLVKRVVGIPGDTVAMRSGELLRNGRAPRESYVEHVNPADDPATGDFIWQREYVARAITARTPYNPSRDNWGPLVVPTGRFFVLGDNRDDSSDSRYWGFVADSAVTGTPLIVYFSYDPDTIGRRAWVTRIRWARLGEIIR